MEQQLGSRADCSPSDTRQAGNPKRFKCSYIGCEKKFTRMEHMQRHALNHTVGESTCPRCNAHFKRPDLLSKSFIDYPERGNKINQGAARHMKRHQQRDLEAGGPGHGSLDTRKRAWKAPDGTVVEKRSRVEGTEALASWDLNGVEASGQIVSPPLSDEGRLGQDIRLELQNDDQRMIVGDFEPSFVISQGLPPRYVPQHSFGDFMSPTASIPRPQHQFSYGQPEYHPALQPDTASSFNMPYTTAVDYNWLFNLESATASAFGLTDCESVLPQPAPEDVYNQNTEHTQDNILTEQERSFQVSTPESRTCNSLTSSAMEKSDNNQWSQGESAASQPASSLGGENNRERHTNSRIRTTITISKKAGPQVHNLRENADISNGARDSSRHRDDPQHRSLVNRQGPSQPEKPLSMLRKPDQLPQLSQSAREKLLVVIETANPNIPNKPVDTPIRDHLLLSQESLQSWLDLFFLQFNTAYPFIHVPTFDTDEAESLLLLSLILLGATYGDKNAHQLAVCIHDVIRPAIFAHAGFSPRPELWTLQTILMVECFGKSRAGQKQHDFSHLFHGLLINLIRRSDCQSSTGPLQVPLEGIDTTLVHDAWKRWADIEQKKRLALLCFMWDTQHAVLFCQSLCMSAFELRCAMPCAQSLWESTDADSWATECRRSQPQSSSPISAQPTFLSSLKAYLSTTDDSIKGRELNALGLVLVLHGIMSIAWDMQRRDQTSLGVNSIIGTMSWRGRLSKAYDRWKVDFDLYCEDAAAVGNPHTTAEWKAFAAAYRAVYHAAQALLHMDFLDLQIYAGARHILGRPVQQQDYVRSSRIVKRWATRDRERAAVSAWHAANMLYELVAVKERDQHSPRGNGQTSVCTHSNLFHVPWCLYLATLTVWAFHHARPSQLNREVPGRSHLEIGEISSGDEEDSSDEIVWDAQEEMCSLVKGMAIGNNAHDSIQETVFSQGRKGTLGLVWVVADLLSKVRWGIIHAGVSVLRGLVPTRLINQYENI